MWRAAVAMLVVGSTGCALLGPLCADRRQSGAVGGISGEVAAGRIVSHRVAYATEGSQNTVEVRWPGDIQPDGPRLAVYATRAGCTNFTLPADANSEDCRPIASAGRIGDVFVRSLNVTHGRGNPEQLGNPPEYILWVVGDPARASTYLFSITWVYPVDC